MTPQIDEHVLKQAQMQAYLRQSTAVPSRMTSLAIWHFNATDIKPANPIIPKEKHLIDTTVRYCLERNITKIPTVFIIDSKIPNAASVNGDDVIFTRALFDAMTPQQLDAIVGHELSHHRHSKRDSYATAAIAMGSGGLAYGAWCLGAEALSHMNHISHRTSTMLKSSQMAYIPIWFAFSASMVPYKFFQEYEADREGAELAGPATMKDALQALEQQVEAYKESRGDKAPDWKQVVLSKIFSPFATHPKTPDRIVALDQLENKLSGYAGRVRDEPSPVMQT